MPTEEHFVSHIDFGDGVVRTIKDPNASGTAVVGVKGDAEESYRHGNVNITKGNIGLGDVENLKQVSATENQGLTDTEKEYARDNLGLGTAATKDIPASGDASTTEVVLGSDSRLSDAREASDVYSWAKASTKPSYTAAEVGAVDVAMVGVAGGIAELDSLGKVPASQLPAYVDDVLEYADLSSFPATGESGKIYVAQDTNKTYRWSGSGYVVISETLALGETSSTAYRGDRGKTAYDHSQSTHARTDATKTEASSTNGNIKINGTETTVYTHPGSGTNPHGTTKSDVGLGNVGNFKAVSTVASQGLSDTEKSNARANIGAGTSSLAIGTTASTAAAGNHTHGLSIASDSGTASISLAANTTYKLTAGGSTYIFKTPVDNNTTYTAATAAPGNIAASGTQGSSTNYARQDHTHGIALATGDNNGQVKIAGTNVSVKGLGSAAYTASTAYAAASHTHSYAGSSSAGGAANSLANFKVTTTTNIGVDAPGTNAVGYISGLTKANWNYQQTDGALYSQWYNASWIHEIYGDYRTGQISIRGKNNGTWQSWRRVLDETNYTTWAATKGHTHATSIAASSGTNQLTLAASTKYAITAGGTSYIFTTPPNTNTWRGIQDNLTSSSNTTESLSAKQGYLLANGSARDSTKAPISHASTATTYGVGNTSNYGHVKLSDTYTSSVGAAANSIGASQYAVYKTYDESINPTNILTVSNPFSRNTTNTKSIASSVLTRTHSITEMSLDFTTNKAFAAWSKTPVTTAYSNWAYYFRSNRTFFGLVMVDGTNDYAYNCYANIESGVVNIITRNAAIPTNTRVVIMGLAMY